MSCHFHKAGASITSSPYHRQQLGRQFGTVCTLLPVFVESVCADQSHGLGVWGAAGLFRGIPSAAGKSLLEREVYLPLPLSRAGPEV